MYCVTVFWSHLMYSSIINNPASSLAVAVKVYFHFPSGVLCWSCLVIRLTTWSRNPPTALPMQGVTTQVSNPKSSTAYTTALKNNPDTCGAAPYLLRMRVILLQTDLAREKFLATTGHSLSASDITPPRYLKEVTISRGHP